MIKSRIFSKLHGYSCQYFGAGDRLNNYLQKILRGQALNYTVFLNKLPESLRRRRQELFATEKVGVNRWIVTVLDPSVIAELQTLAEAPLSRADAARKGDSHRHGTNVSFLLAYHRALKSRRPDVIVIAGNAIDMGFHPASRVLVVENERNFYCFRQMLAFAGEVLNKPLGLSECDVVLGGGNRITRAAVLEWLGGYEEVLCAFDYDAGGLQMYSTIVSALGDAAVFVQPADWQPWLELFVKKPDTTERFTRALRLAEDLGFVSLAQAFRATGHFMEQEVILDE